MRLSSGEKLIKRLRAMGLDLPDVVRVEHTNAGRVQKAAGAWSWYLVDHDGKELRVGGFLAVTELLRGPMIATRAPSRVPEDTHIDVFSAGDDVGVEGKYALFLVEVR